MKYNSFYLRKYKYHKFQRDKYLWKFNIRKMTVDLSFPHFSLGRINAKLVLFMYENAVKK